MNLKGYIKDNIQKNSFSLDDVLDAVKIKKRELKDEKNLKKDLRRFKK